MANPFEMFETDAALETEGIIIDYGDFRFKVARAGGANKKFTNLINARLKPYEKQFAAGTMDDEVAAQILREVYAATIILEADVLVKQEDKTDQAPDAPNEYKPGLIMDRDGTVAPFTKENVVKFFKALPMIFQSLKKDAEDFALFKKVQQEEAIKNS